MKNTTVILMTLMLTSVSLAGCIGDEYQETIDQLEAEAMANQERMDYLSETVDSLEGNIAQLDVTIASLNSHIADLGAQIAGYQSDVALLNEHNDTKGAAIDQMTLNITSLEEMKSNLEAQVISLESAASALSATILDLQDTIFERVENPSWGAIGSPPYSTLDTIIARGFMKCGVKDSQYGMGYLDSDTGERSGLDISYCRAVAAAIGLDPDTDVYYIPASGSNRFDLLANGDVDVLIRTTTWTAYRDATYHADFAAVNFYDGQGILVRSDAFAYGTGSAVQLDGANICVGVGTTSERNLDSWFLTNGISFTAVPTSGWWDAREKLKNGDCDAMTGDMSAMVARKWYLENSDDTENWRNSGDYSDLWIATESLTKEPLAAMTRDYDSEWNEVVSWVWYGMITAEELGVTSDNYDNLDYSCDGTDSNYDAYLCRLLGDSFGLGTNDNPLSSTWMQDVLEAVGNYGEAYDDAFCDGTYDGVSGSDAMTDCLLSRSGTLNALVSEGGIQFAPSMR